MRYIDTAVQTLLWVAMLAMIAPFSFTAILLGQFALGVWQMISCVLSIIFIKTYKKEKLIHLFVSVICLIGIALDPNGMLLWTVPWALAIYYSVLTWMWCLKSDSKQGKFLPHTSF